MTDKAVVSLVSQNTSLHVNNTLDLTPSLNAGLMMVIITVFTVIVYCFKLVHTPHHHTIPACVGYSAS